MKIRLLGGALLLACLLAFQPGAQTDLQRLWLPLLMGLGAALTLRNVLAVAITGALLGLIRLDLAANDWILSQAYPGIALCCMLVAVSILGRRYYRYMLATRQARQARRSSTEL